MSIDYTAHVEPWYTLDEINHNIEQLERKLGPLTEIGFDSKSTVLKLQYAAPPPAIYSVIRRSVAGKPDIPDGWSLVDEGVVFIEGILVLCAASRPA